MAQWLKIQQMNPQIINQIQKIYTEASFPIEVRHFFYKWIEEQPWDKLDHDNPAHGNFAQQLLNSLLTEIKNKIVELHQDEFFPIRIKLLEAESNFTKFYGCTPFLFVDTIKHLLNTERQLMQVEEPEAVQELQMNVPDTRSDEITAALESLKTNTTTTENEYRQLQSKQESFIIQYQESAKISTHLKQINQQIEKTGELRRREETLKKQKEEVEAHLTQKAQELLKLRILIADRYSETVSTIDNIQKIVLDEELIKWKRHQQHAGNGKTFDGGLDQLQNWCEELADLNWTNRQQIQRCQQLQAQLPIELPPGQMDLLPDQADTITGLLSTLVTSTFIVSGQPPQVLKKDSRFSASVRLLVGGKLNVHMTPPTVKATIISEKQAQDLLKNDSKAKNETSGEILNNTGTMDFQQQTSKLSITFRNMQLKRIKRADRKGNEAVTEEKFCILFQSDFKVGGNELLFQVWTLSLPVVVIVHGNQECNAHATILWDNAFSESCRIPFHVPDQVTWTQLKEQLDIKFKAITGRGLTEDHLNYLATKLFDGQIPANEDFSSCLVSWALFNKEQVKGRNFTFWEWLYAVAKLVKEHLKDPWNDGSVIGFISKCQAQEWLFTKPNGTFLLRFSDSEPGGITIAWVDDKANGKLEVWNLKPFGAKDFTIRSLADRIKDLSNLVYLYPDIPKENAFGKYFTSNPEQGSPSTDGYIKPNLMTVIPDCYGQPYNPDNPQTPQIMEPFSPATSTTTFDRSPGSVLTQQSQDEQMQCDLEDFCLFSTDYAPEDIEQINVNDLLYQTPT